MNSSEAKKVKRRKSKKCEPFKTVGNHGKLIIDATVSLPDEKILNTNQSPNSEAISKIEQMMDSGNDPLPTVEMSQEANPYFNGDKCLICHQEKGVLSAPPVPLAPKNCKSVSIWDLTYDISMLSQLWVCPNCRVNMEERKRDNDDMLKLKSDIDLRIPMTEFENSNSLPLAITKSLDGGGESAELCLCQKCIEQRKIENQKVREALQLQHYWSEIWLAVRQIYQESGIGCPEDKRQMKFPSLEKIRKMVHTLCLRSPHQLYTWLEYRGRELVIEMKISLLKQLANLAKTPQQAKAFITDLLDNYAKLCSACKKLHPFLLELEQDHLKMLGLSWELVNRHLFQNLVYSDPRLQDALPYLISQLRSSVSNENEEKQLTELLHKYLLFDEQMTIVASMWMDADPFIQEFNIEQAAIKSKQRILHADWELFKLQHKILEHQIIKKVDISTQSLSNCSCACDGCTLQCMVACGILPHHDPMTQPASDLGVMRNANGHCLPNNFMPSVMNNMDSLNSVLCTATPGAGLCLSKVKEQWCGSFPAITNSTMSNLKNSSITDEERRYWFHTIPTVSHRLTPPPSAQDVQTSGGNGNGDIGVDENDDEDEDVEDEDCDEDEEVDDDEDVDIDGIDDDEGDDEDDDEGEGFPILDEEIATLDMQSCTGCPTGNQDCQCHHCTSSGNRCDCSPSSVISVEKTSTEHPCECHICVFNTDRATIPTVVNVPPRPALLHLYPHIHGSNANHSLQNTHMLKPFLHPQLYGLRLPCSKNPYTSTLFDSDSTAAVTESSPPSILPDHIMDYYRGSHDWDIVYENAKMLLNSRKCNEILPTPAVSMPEEVLMLAESASVEAGGEGAHMMPDLVTTHSNKATQASGPLPFSVGYPQGPMDLNHLKYKHPHTHGSLPVSCATAVLQEEQQGAMTACHNECRHKANLPYGGRPGAGKTLPRHHGQPSMGGASKHPCKDFVFNLPETPESPLSICPNKDGENSHVDTEESIDDSCSEQSSSTSTSNQKDNKHCDCCYCEVFGHDVNSSPTTSRNYPEMRDKLRQRLNKKKMEYKSEDSVPQGLWTKRFYKPPTPKPLEDCRDLDTLISFINGSVTSENEDSAGSSNKLSSTKVLKKSVKKKKKVDPRQSKIRGEACCNSPLDEEVDRLNSLSMLDGNSYYSKTEHRCTLAAPTIFTATQGTATSVNERTYSPANQSRTTDCAKMLPVKTDVKMTCLQRSKTENGHSQEDSLPEDGFSKQIKKCCWSPDISVESMINSDPSESNGFYLSPQPAFPSSNTLPQSSSPTLVKDRASKKKRKPSQQTSSLSSTTCSLSGMSSYRSTCGASKDEIPCLAPHFEQLQVSVADHKRNAPSPQAASVMRSGDTSPTLLNRMADAARHFNIYQAAPPELPKLICNGGDKVLPKNRVSLISNKIPVESRTNVITSNNNNNSHTSNTELPVKTKPKREDRKKPDSVPNHLQNSAKKMVNGSNLKVNVKIASNAPRDTCPSPGKTVGKNKRNKKKGGSAGDSGIDDVFVPRDIDLDNGELDEMEREVEAFKRFCWNSKPLANKEKVNVNLKDIMLRKKVALECI